MKIKRIGVDTAKSVFHLCATNREGKVLWRKKLGRNQWLDYIQTNAPAGIEVGMEACGGSHNWAHELISRGFEPKLIAPQHVKPYRKSHKTDHADAEAIAEAMSRPEMRFVAIKTREQLSIQSLHRRRDEVIKHRTALTNQIRGFAAERGLVANLGACALRKAMAKWLDPEQELLSGFDAQLLSEMRDELIQMEQRVKTLDTHVKKIAQTHPVAIRLQELRGVGPVCATILAANLGDGSAFRNGRDYAVSLGLTPRQHSTGGKERLFGISKRGDHYIRKQLVHGARSAVTAAKGKEDTLSQWIQRLGARKHVNVVTIALAAKTARMAWALASQSVDYDPRLAAAASA